MKTAQCKGKTPKDETLRYAHYVILFTTSPADEYSEIEVLVWYRLRWQVELVFKRFKSLAQPGHLPKEDDESSQAWLYGKLMAALLNEKFARHVRTFSPMISCGNEVSGVISSSYKIKFCEQLSPITP